MKDRQLHKLTYSIPTNPDQLITEKPKAVELPIKVQKKNNALTTLRNILKKFTYRITPKTSGADRTSTDSTSMKDRPLPELPQSGKQEENSNYEDGFEYDSIQEQKIELHNKATTLGCDIIGQMRDTLETEHSQEHHSKMQTPREI